MPKQIYTKDDIAALVDQGMTILQTDDDIVVTSEAHDLAQKLGLQIIYTPDQPETPRQPGQIHNIQSRARHIAADWKINAVPPTVDLHRLRHYRLNSIRREMAKLDCGACVLVDAVNVRYATDSRNMQIFSSRNPSRYLFLPLEGPVILFEFDRCDHLSDGLDTIDEIRPATTVSYVAAADVIDVKTEKWANEIADLMRQYGGGSRRIGIERFNFHAGLALRRIGFDVIDAQHPVERARAIKSADEIECIKWSMRVTEHAVQKMQDKIRPGMTENEIWAVLHHALIANNGDYVETRLLSSGPRTNPWMQEASNRVVEASDLVALDTDVVGPFGYYSDFSRTFYCGTGTPSPEQKKLYRLAYDQLHHDLELFKPGASFREIAEKAWKIPDIYAPNRYFVLAHGVGMTGEYPYVLHLQDFDQGYDGILEPGMTLCMETYIGEHSDSETDDGSEGVKLEQQIVITETGYELLSQYPFDENLLGREI